MEILILLGIERYATEPCAGEYYAQPGGKPGIGSLYRAHSLSITLDVFRKETLFCRGAFTKEFHELGY
jgi:hypothetical protein